MRAIALSLLAGLACLALADTHADIVDLAASMANAITEENAAGFMKSLDPNMPDYDTIRARITALIETSEISNSVEPVKDEGNEAKRTVDLDWYMELRSRAAAGPLIHRREVIHLVAEKQGRHWRVTSLQPIDFFAAPKY